MQIAFGRVRSKAVSSRRCVVYGNPVTFHSFSVTERQAVSCREPDTTLYDFQDTQEDSASASVIVVIPQNCPINIITN